MSLDERAYVTDHADSTDYEPMVVEGSQVGEAQYLRTEGSHVVLEGSVSIQLAETGERVDLKAGDIASFNSGTRSVWTFTEPFKKFTVISD
jgi:uncharacterized protein